MFISPGLSFPGKSHPPEYALLHGITANASHLAEYSRGVSNKQGPVSIYT